MSVVRTETVDGVCTVTMCDEQRRNALSRELLAGMVEAFETAEADDDVRVIVLTNAGNTFCAGADLSERRGSSEDIPTISPLDLFARFAKSPKPYVGRIAGHCVAGGMGLAAAMDISVADEAAKFGFTEVRIGVAPAMISVVCLPKMRRADARATFLRGQRFLGRDAAAMGLINDAVPAADLDAAVDAVVDDLLLGGPEAMGWCKKLLADVPTMSVDDAFEWTAGVSSALFGSEEAQEGMGAFLERRPPSFARTRGNVGATPSRRVIQRHDIVAR